MLSPLSLRAADFAAPATPPGVTVEPAIQNPALEAGKPASATQGSFADANGMTLYTFAGDTVPGRSACDGDCAASWPALAAPADAKAMGDWTLVGRGDGSKQWAYKGKPLYRSAMDAAPGDAKGKGSGDGQWQIAALRQSEDETPAPAGVALRPVGNALGDVFVDHRGMTLYVFDGDAAPGVSACAGSCARIWMPLKAAELAKPIGDWTVIVRDDGFRQWAFKGKPLYAFSGDGKPGDANGGFVDKRWRPAAVHRYFMPTEISLRLNSSGPVLATSDGFTLYARDKFRFSFGGYSVNDGPPATPAIGRSIGPAGCAGDCAKTWLPLKAPADAHPSGFWSIALRDDGTRQWAYQGYPVYTNVNDRKPGDMVGRDLFDLTDGSHALYWRVVTPSL
jgi:predicted lipoprotein with Yx(FWY)xxD motif